MIRSKKINKYNKMYGMGAFNWIDLKGHHRNHRMERHPHLYHSSHTDYPDHHNSPHHHILAPTTNHFSDRHKHRQPQLEDWEQKQNLKEKVENKVLNYFINNVKEKFKEGLRKKPSQQQHQPKPQQERYQMRCSSAKSKTVPVPQQPLRSMQIHKKELTGAAIPAFQNKKLAHIKRNRTRKPKHYSQLEPHKQSIQCGGQEHQSLSHYDRDYLEESDELYLRTQERAKQAERNSPSPDSAFNTHSIQSHERQKITYENQFIHLGARPLNHEKTQRQVSSAFSVMSISKIQIKPISSQNGIKNEPGQGRAKRPSLQGRKKVAQRKSTKQSLPLNLMLDFNRK